MWQALAAGAALGLAKNALVDKPKEEKQRALAAQTALYSPWTGMKPNEVQMSDPFGNALQGATAGAMFSQAAQQQNMNNELLKLKQQQVAGMAQPQPNLYGGNASAVYASPYQNMV